IFDLKNALESLFEVNSNKVKNLPMYSNYKGLNSSLRQASGMINEHEKITKDKFSVVECRLSILQEAFDRYPSLFGPSALSPAFKLKSYVSTRIKNAVEIYDNLHEDLQCDLKDQMEYVLEFAEQHKLDQSLYVDIHSYYPSIFVNLQKYTSVNIQEILDKHILSEQVKRFTSSIQKGKPKVHLKGLVGSSDAMVAAACYQLEKRLNVFILPTHEEASYFLSDLESLFDNQILFFPASYRKAFDFTILDSANVLQRAETLSSLNRDSELPKIVVTYPEAISEKVINKQDLEKNTLEIRVGTKLSIDFINEFLYEYDFERVDFVYEPGQFAIRGGIVDIFSFSNDLPYRIEFFGDEIDSIRTFEIESQLSVNKINSVTIVPNVQAKFLSNNHISLLEYIERDSIIWIKDVQFTLDILQEGYKKASKYWKALTEKEIKDNPDWVDP